MKKKSLSAQKIIPNLKNKSLNLIFKNFEKKLDKNQIYCVAISGGPDSLALAYLTKCFSDKYKNKFYYYVVDHKLRPESSKEAALVVNLLKKIKIKCKILKWIGKKPKSNIQSLARFQRYSLLLKECKKNKINNIVLGHHKDDRDENFFIRLTRGSGLKGLVSFSEKSQNFNVNFLRPLINFEKEQLIYISKKVFKGYINDPSNKDEKFKRIRIRNLINELKKEGFDKDKLNLTLNNLKDSNEALEFYSNKNIFDNSSFNFKKNQVILNKSFFEQPKEIILRSVTNLMLKISKNYYPPRGKRIKRLLDTLELRQNVKNQTLGGCIFKKVNESIIISKEIS